MPWVDIHLHAELNDFVAPRRRHRTFPCPLTRRTSVKDLIEAQGVPHPEINVIVVDGVSVGFDYRLDPAKGAPRRLDVYPWSLTPALVRVRHLRPRPTVPPRWILDVHLGRLAGYLRLLGFDCHYRNDGQDAELAARSAAESRVLLTRDRRLLMRRCISLGYYVRATAPRHQLEELCAAFDLVEAFAPFTRCSHCNERLMPVPKAEILHRLPPRTRRYVHHFLRCRGCDRLYWHGSHLPRMQALVASLERGHREALSYR